MPWNQSNDDRMPTAHIITIGHVACKNTSFEIRISIIVFFQV